MDYSKELLSLFKEHKWIQFFNIIDILTNKLLQNKYIEYPFRDDIVQEMRYYCVTQTRRFLVGKDNIHETFKEWLTVSMRREIYDMLQRNSYHYFIPRRGSKYYKNQTYEELL